MDIFLKETQIPYFEQRNWERLRKRHKIKILEEVIKNFTDYYKMEWDIQVLFVKFPPIFGKAEGYSNFNKGLIVLNDNYFNHNFVYQNSYFKKEKYKYTTINLYHILMHELRHFYQIWVMKHPQINPELAQKVKNNFYRNEYRDNYINIFNTDAYMCQFVERDAIEYELKQIDNYIKLLKNDEELNELLAKKEFIIKRNDTAYQNLQQFFNIDNPIPYIDESMSIIANKQITCEDIYPNDTELHQKLNQLFPYKGMDKIHSQIPERGEKE